MQLGPIVYQKTLRNLKMLYTSILNRLFYCPSMDLFFIERFAVLHLLAVNPKHNRHSSIDANKVNRFWWLSKDTYCIFRWQWWMMAPHFLFTSSPTRLMVCCAYYVVMCIVTARVFRSLLTTSAHYPSFGCHCLDLHYCLCVCGSNAYICNWISSQ